MRVPEKEKKKIVERKEEDSAGLQRIPLSATFVDGRQRTGDPVEVHGGFLIPMQISQFILVSQLGTIRLMSYRPAVDAFWRTFDARKVMSPTATLIRDSPSDTESGAGGLILINSRFDRKSQEIFAIAA